MVQPASKQTGTQQGWRRRSVLSAGCSSLLGMSLPTLCQARSLLAGPVNHGAPNRAGRGSYGRAKGCILLFMWGGPAQQETWDLKPNAPQGIRGEFQPIATEVPDLQISEHFPLLAQRTSKLCVIRSMTHNNVDHTTSTHFLLTGQPPLPGRPMSQDWPHMGAVLSKLGRGRDPLPAYVSMRPKLPGDVPRFVEESRGQFAGWLGQAHYPLTIDANPNEVPYRVGDFELQPGISVDRLDRRWQLLETIEQQLHREGPRAGLDGMSRHYARAFDLLHSAAAQGAFNLEQEPAAVRLKYGRHPHGQSVLQARRLIERGVPLVTVFWPNDGIKNVSVYWDTHSRNFVDLKQRLMPPADQAFSALLDDLQERGLLEDTLVIWTGEFGRTPRIGQRNSDAGAGADGRDHWPNCFSTVLAGAGIKPGCIYGASDKHAAYPAANPLAPVDLVATIYHLLGVPPELSLTDDQNRPQIVCPGQLVPELLA